MGRLVWAGVVLCVSILCGALWTEYTQTTQRAAPTFTRAAEAISEGFLRQSSPDGSERPPYIIGHRGSSLLDPENTLMGFSKALGVGSDVIHANLQRNRENKLFLFHGTDLHAVCDTDLAHQSFRNLSNEEVARLDAGYNFTVDGVVYPFRGKGLQVPSFYQWMLRFQDFPMLVEIEEDSERITDVLIEELRTYLDAIEAQGRELPPALYTRFLATSKHSNPLIRYRERTMNRFPTACSERETFFLYLLYRVGHPISYAAQRWSVDVLPACQAVIVPPRAGSFVQFADPKFIEFAHSVHVDVVFSLINDPREMIELLEMGADGLVTGRCDVGAKALVKSGWKTEEGLEKQKNDAVDFDILQYEVAENEQEAYQCVSILCHLLVLSPRDPFQWRGETLLLCLLSAALFLTLILISCSLTLLCGRSSLASTPPATSKSNNVTRDKSEASSVHNKPKGKKANKKSN